jgi:hypothetical protein
MNCYAYNCPETPTKRLKAWGPGEVRAFCEDCAELRDGLSGYTTEGVEPTRRCHDE